MIKEFPGNLSISRTSGDIECIRIEVRINGVVRPALSAAMSCEDFALALTGRAQSPAVVSLPSPPKEQAGG